MAYIDPWQSNPSANSPTNLGTVPAAHALIASTLAVCNTGTADATVRVSVRNAGASADTKQYLLYDTPIAGNESKFFTIGLTASSGTIITVYASTAAIAFNLSAAIQDIV